MRHGGGGESMGEANRWNRETQSKGESTVARIDAGVFVADLDALIGVSFGFERRDTLCRFKHLFSL